MGARATASTAKGLRTHPGAPRVRPVASLQSCMRYSSRLLVGRCGRAIARHDAAFRRCSLPRGGPIDVPLSWEQLCDGPKVFVSLGTVNQARGQRLLRCDSQEAARGCRTCKVVLVAPEVCMVPNPPPRCDWADFVPQVELAGDNGCRREPRWTQHRMRILVGGPSLGLVVPIKDDQPVIAQQVKSVDEALEFDPRWTRHWVRKYALRSATRYRTKAYREHGSATTTLTASSVGGATSAR